MKIKLGSNKRSNVYFIIKIISLGLKWRGWYILLLKFCWFKVFKRQDHRLSTINFNNSSITFYRSCTEDLSKIELLKYFNVIALKREHCKIVVS